MRGPSGADARDAGRQGPGLLVKSRRTPDDLLKDVSGEPPGRYGPEGRPCDTATRGHVVAQLRTNGHRVVEAHLNGDSVKALTGSLIGEGSGEPFSLQFSGTGRVWIQPAER